MKKVAVGVDIGGTNSAYGLVDEQGNILSEGVFPTRNFPDSDLYIEELYIGIQNLLKTAGEEYELIGVGIGAPNGNFYKGTIEFAPNLPWKGTVNLVEKMKRFFPTLPVIVTNDANAAALGEAKFGASAVYESSIFITLGTGVGGGIIVGGKMLEGYMSAGAEIGHMILREGGALCGCGRHGCFECYASATALIRQTKKKMEDNCDSKMWEVARNSLDNVDGRTAFEAARQGDKDAQEVVKKYVGYLSEGIADLVNILRPEAIVLGGGIANEGEALFVPLRKAVDERSYISSAVVPLKIVGAKLGNDAGMIGAARFFMQHS